MLFDCQHLESVDNIWNPHGSLAHLLRTNLNNDDRFQQLSDFHTIFGNFQSMATHRLQTSEQYAFVCYDWVKIVIFAINIFHNSSNYTNSNSPFCARNNRFIYLTHLSYFWARRITILIALTSREAGRVCKYVLNSWTSIISFTFSSYTWFSSFPSHFSAWNYRNYKFMSIFFTLICKMFHE